MADKLQGLLRHLRDTGVLSEHVIARATGNADVSDAALHTVSIAVAAASLTKRELRRCHKPLADMTATAVRILKMPNVGETLTPDQLHASLLLIFGTPDATDASAVAAVKAATTYPGAMPLLHTVSKTLATLHPYLRGLFPAAPMVPAHPPPTGPNEEDAAIRAEVATVVDDRLLADDVARHVSELRRMSKDATSIKFLDVVRNMQALFVRRDPGGGRALVIRVMYALRECSSPQLWPCVLGIAFSAVALSGCPGGSGVDCLLSIMEGFAVMQSMYRLPLPTAV